MKGKSKFFLHFKSNNIKMITEYSETRETGKEKNTETIFI